MDYLIRPAGEADFPAVLDLIRELALYEKAPEKVTNSVEQMIREQEFFRCLVAVQEDGRILGMALYFFAYYTWVGKSLYLDDIYVKEPYRRLGIGSALLQEVFGIARIQQCKRVRWQVLNWNEPAIRLYAKSGAEIDSDWLNCSFDEEGIDNYGK